MKLNLPDAVSSRFGHQLLVVQKHSPRLMFVAGMGLMGATVVSACRGTLRLEETLDEIRSDREAFKTRVELVDGTDKQMSDYDVKRMNAYLYVRSVAKVGKLYMPSIVMGSLAVAALTGAHNTLNRRNAGLSAALAATDRAINSYRDRVREELGEDRENELYRGITRAKVPVLDDEGRETKSKKTIVNASGRSPYSFLFSPDTSTEFDPNSDYNLAKLRSVQEWATMTLNHKGHLFLNDVFDELGIERTPAGAVCGWLSTKYGGQDGFVDLGVLSQGHEVEWLDFARGLSDALWLDPNVDGEIWRKI